MLKAFAQYVGDVESEAPMMQLRRMSTLVATAGGALLASAAAVAVFAPLGMSSTTVSQPDGSTRQVDERVSIWVHDHQAARGVLVFALVFSVVAIGLIRFGGPVGRLLVVLVCGLSVLASLLSVGIFLMPGAGLLVVGAALGEGARLERRALRRLPPPPLPV